MSEKEKKLGPNSTIRELFDAVRVTEGAKVFPVTVCEDMEGDYSELMLMISGKYKEATAIMANLMTVVNAMHEQAEQMRRSGLIDAAGKPIEDEPAILVPGSDS